jgi:hypothetical protein
MTLPSSGPLSLNDLNVEFGRAGTTQLSISESFAGTYTQYGNINRNTAPGRTVFTTFTGSLPFRLSEFYDYNDVENNYWYWTFDNTNYDHDIEIHVVLASNDIYNNTVLANSTDSSGTYVDTGYSATTGNNLDFQIIVPVLGYLDIIVEDPDTTAIIYSVSGVSMNDYKGLTNLSTVYGYQRLNFYVFFIN